MKRHIHIIIFCFVFGNTYLFAQLEDIAETATDSGSVDETATDEKTESTGSETTASRLADELKSFDSKNFKKGMSYFFQKKFEMAEYLLQEELKENPENYFAYSYLGDIFLLKKRYDEAITLYKRALDLRPDFAENHFRLGQAYYYKRIGNLAISHFTEAYHLNPQIKYSHYHIGLTNLMILRDKGKTISSWLFYLSIAPEDPQYEKIRRAIELLKDPSFVIPPVGSDISLEEALHLGGSVLSKTERSDTSDKGAGHEAKKTVDHTADIERDDDL
ncbi:MAG: tetratricopeptide repeat protein [Spirochaetes bacterium]|jgi:tetratricopeptide (TPR) repeat protein|nr:tetratricopeptide repeat protein [Spirochaetota bacterium]